MNSPTIYRRITVLRHHCNDGKGHDQRNPRSSVSGQVTKSDLLKVKQDAWPKLPDKFQEARGSFVYVGPGLKMDNH